MARVRKHMQRRITSTVATYQLVEVSGGQGQLSEPKTVKLQGKLKEHQVHSKLKDKLEDKFVVTNINHESKLYRMTLEDFMANAEVVEDDTEQ